MKKSYIISIIITIIIIIIAVIIGSIFINKTSNINAKSKKELSKEDENIQNEIQTIATSTSEEKTSPNCIIIFKTYYKECKHTVIKKVDIPKELVNKTLDELKKEYSNWKVEKFNVNEVVLFKEGEGICKEHFVVREDNEYITIYSVDNYGVETIKETTKILTTYLPQIDKDKLKEGIKVNGQQELNACLEDYE